MGLPRPTSATGSCGAQWSINFFADEEVLTPTGHGNVIWPMGDHLGTNQDLGDFNGTAFSITNHRTYDSFGNRTAETNAAVDELFGYTGKYFDEDTQLSNHWNRWYGPTLVV